MRSALILLTLFAAAMAAQTASVPVVGYSFDAVTAAVRPILGVPGSSHLGAPLALPADLKIVRLSPAAGLAVAVAGDAAVPLVYDLETAARMPLDNARPNPSGVVWSSSGTAIALTFDGGWTQVFARAAGAWTLSSEFASTATQIAVSDDGTAALLSQPDGLYFRDAAGSSLLTASAGAFAFLAGSTTPAYLSGQRLAAGDSAADIDSADNATYSLASPRAGTLLLARSDGRVMIFDSSLQVRSDTVCNCAVSGLEPAARAGTLRLVTATGGILWLAGTTSDDALYFVPAPRDPDAQ